MLTTEVRCPGKFKKLFLVLRQEYLPAPGMFMEIACADCTRDVRKQTSNVLRVLHYYDTQGLCVRTKIVKN